MVFDERIENARTLRLKLNGVLGPDYLIYVGNVSIKYSLYFQNIIT